MTFQLDVYVASISATYTRNGDVFLGMGASRQYPRVDSVGVSITNGWMQTDDNKEPSQEALNNFLNGWSAQTGGFVLVGGSYQINAEGSAYNLGVGFGRLGFNPGIVNSYRGNVFGE